MKVLIAWFESVSYESEIELGPDDLAAMHSKDLDPTSPEDVEVYLKYECAESNWFEQCDTTRDFNGASDRELDEVREIVDIEPITVTSFTGDDGVQVVQVDTAANGGRVRINLNDAPVWDDDPELGGQS